MGVSTYSRWTRLLLIICQWLVLVDCHYLREASVTIRNSDAISASSAIACGSVKNRVLASAQRLILRKDYVELNFQFLTLDLGGMSGHVLRLGV